MELYPHNELAYQNATEMLAHHGRACIVHPTGTGKNVIIAKFISENPDKKHYVFAPGLHIFSEIKKHTDILFTGITYQGLLSDIQVIKDADFIYLDEFHRCGANIWGERISGILNKNPDAKILGTSATPIRFLDSHRDMSDELFDGYVASHISLNEAIQSGILPAPCYVASLYSVDKELQTLLTKAERSKSSAKDGVTDRLRESVIDWKESHGMEVVLRRHLTPDRNRIIVFCPTLNAARTIEENIMPALRDIFINVECFHINSLQSKKKAEQLMQEFISAKSASVIFTVDKFNEGLHVPGVDTVILFRQTKSATIYYQQIGRAFSTNASRQPLIFDFVNTFNSLYIKEFKTLKKSYENYDFNQFGRGITKNRFPVVIHDEVKDLEDLFRGFSDALERWDMMYEEAKDYYEKNGHLHVPTTQARLLRWLQKQKSFNNTGVLSEGRKMLLDEIGMDWSPTFKNATMAKIESVGLFKEKNGALPTQETNKELWTFINSFRYRASKGIFSEDLLQAAQEVFGLEGRQLIKKDEWQKNYEAAKLIYKNEGVVYIPQKNHPLSNWGNTVQMYQRTGKLTTEKKEMLEEINFVTDRSEYKWQQMLDSLKKFVAENGRLPQNNGEEKPLASWYYSQQKKIKNGSLEENKKKLIEYI